jgi:acetyl-CoA carboxylase biotin carboxyl carrier protein
LNTKDIKQIVEMMKQADLTEFEIEEENFRLRIARGSASVAAPQYIPPRSPGSSCACYYASPGGPGCGSQARRPGHQKPNGGHLLHRASPDSPSFVQVGSKVSASSVVCIIEAMKVMNEIQAEQAGTIAEMLVENGQSVEYGQPLFRLTSA